LLPAPHRARDRRESDQPSPARLEPSLVPDRRSPTQPQSPLARQASPPPRSRSDVPVELPECAKRRGVAWPFPSPADETHSNDINPIGAPFGRAAGDPAGYVTEFGGTQHVVYV